MEGSLEVSDSSQRDYIAKCDPSTLIGILNELTPRPLVNLYSGTSEN